MRHDPHALDLSSGREPSVVAASQGIGWRHLATMLLLLITLPVFVAAGAVALTLLPFLVALAGFEQIRQLLRPAPTPAPIRLSR